MTGTAGTDIRECLEGAVYAQAAEFGVALPAFERLLDLLRPLAVHNIESYLHSLRVSIYTSRLAADGPAEVPPQLALEGGAAHDIGKLDIPNAVLRANPFGTRHRQAVASHAVAGFRRLQSTHRDAVIIAGLHHAFQQDPYGMKPENVHSPELIEAAQMVSVCDYFDAFVTRHNCYKQDHPHGPIWQVMADNFPQHPGWVGWLVEHGPVT